MSCFTGKTSVPGIEPETYSQVFWSPHQGAGPFLLNLQFSVGSEPPGARKTFTLEKIHCCFPGSNPGRLAGLPIRFFPIVFLTPGGPEPS